MFDIFYTSTFLKRQNMKLKMYLVNKKNKKKSKNYRLKLMEKNNLFIMTCINITLYI